MPDAEERTQARQMLLSQWVMFAPDEATDWLAKQPASEQKEMRATVGTMFMMSDPKKGASFMMEGATAEEKPSRYATVVSSWAATNPDAAATWLAEQGSGPELDQARSSLVFSLYKKKPAAAMDNARAITEENLRVSTATMVYQKWKVTDVAAADKGLDNLGLIAEQIQQIKSSADTDNK